MSHNIKAAVCSDSFCDNIFDVFLNSNITNEVEGLSALRLDLLHYTFQERFFALDIKHNDIDVPGCSHGLI